MDDQVALYGGQGYVRLVGSWGGDENIIEAARMSTGKGFLGWGPKCVTCGNTWVEYPLGRWGCIAGCEKKPEDGAPGDEKLLKYLWDHQHTSPFEFGELVVEVKAPIFVFREWHRHRTQSYSEISARYAPLPDEDYRPHVEDVYARAAALTANRQAQGSGASPHKAQLVSWLQELDAAHKAAQQVYERGLALGVPKELARLVVPVARFSRMRAKTDLLNWLKFLRLRCAPNAQAEIREAANGVAYFVRKLWPRTYAVAQQSCGLP